MLSAQVAVHSGDDLQAAVTAASCGTTITVDAGTYGAITATDKSCSGPSYITIQAASCPHAGRPTSEAMTGMPVISSGTSAENLVIALGADYYRFVCIGFLSTEDQNASILIGSPGSDQDTEAKIPTHVQFDRIILYSIDGKDLVHAISQQGNDVEMTRSWLSNIKSSADAQCFFSSNSFGPTLFNDNYCEASGENILLGGAQAFVTGAMPKNVTITNSTFSKRAEWKSTEYTMKNIFEIKAGEDVLFDHNTVCCSWVDGQQGWGVVITPRGWADAGAWTHDKRVTISNSVFTDICTGIQMTGETDGESGDVTLFDSSDYVIDNNLWVYTAADADCAGGGGKFTVATLSPDSVSFTHNTIVGNRNHVQAVYYTTNAASGNPTGFTMTDNVILYGGGPFFSAAWGTADLDSEFGMGGWTFTGNCWGGYIPGGWTSGDIPSYWPGGTNVYIDTDENMRAMFIDALGGNYRMVSGATCEGKGVNFALLPGGTGGGGVTGTGTHKNILTLGVGGSSTN